MHKTTLAHCIIDTLQSDLIIRFKVEHDVVRINDPANLRRTYVSILEGQRFSFNLLKK